MMDMKSCYKAICLQYQVRDYLFVPIFNNLSLGRLDNSINRSNSRSAQHRPSSQMRGNAQNSGYDLSDDPDLLQPRNGM